MAAQEKNGRDTHEILNGVLWMQTSAEYRMVADLVYKTAQLRLDQALNDPGWTAATEQQGDFGMLPPAVVLDLDETVMDNTPQQAQLVLDRKGFDPFLWNVWTRQKEAGEVPGAVSFIGYAQSRNVAVFFITNRSTADVPATCENLVRLGLKGAQDRILVKQPGLDWDKSERRKKVAASHRILLLVGDDLGDFISVSNLSPAERLAKAGEYKAFWGTRWIVLPNPLYGSWERALFPGLNSMIPGQDAEVLQAKRSALKGMKRKIPGA